MSGLRTLKDIEHTIHLTNIITELREAAKDGLNVFKINREMDQDDEAGIDEAFIRIFFNLEDYDK